MTYWCYCVKNVSNNSIGGQWWRNDPCVSLFLLPNIFPATFVNMPYTNFWQFLQISDFILHDRCRLKLFYNTYWSPWFNKTLILKFEQANKKLWTKTHFCTAFFYALNFSMKLLTKASLYNKLRLNLKLEEIFFIALVYRAPSEIFRLEILYHLKS